MALAPWLDKWGWQRMRWSGAESIRFSFVRIAGVGLYFFPFLNYNSAPPRHTAVDSIGYDGTMAKKAWREWRTTVKGSLT
jgi:hypothetical protein